MGGLCFANDSHEEHQTTRIRHHDRALLDLKRRRRDCGEYIKRMDEKLLETKTAALAAARQKNRAKAMVALKLKKMFEQTKSKSLGMLQMLESTIAEVEGAALNVDVHEALKTGDRVIRELRAQATLDEFQELYENLGQHDEVAEFIEKTVIGDEEYSNELKELENELANVAKSKDKRKSEIKDDMPAKRKKVEEPVALPS
eukprot:TRINITY_DN13621_c0_g1_i1.p1 TRINITY_DN13621_c0_g1~~TRINITY_DN13621_c0_g1_i1.p1  ORF type:complete len:201 (+),score=76.20 TRINITY_DN13621_c0_g1_i1:74-676(+)